MSNPTYIEHLAGIDWQVVRGDVLARANYRCEECGSPWGLQVHHKTYERLGNETLDDLVCLCRDCHRKKHDIA
jgi:5-methylcytosine-specific restriction endonuclease McrA